MNLERKEHYFLISSPFLWMKYAKILTQPNVITFSSSAINNISSSFRVVHISEVPLCFGIISKVAEKIL